MTVVTFALSLAINEIANQTNANKCIFAFMK